MPTSPLFLSFTLIEMMILRECISHLISSWCMFFFLSSYHSILKDNRCLATTEPNRHISRLFPPRYVHPTKKYNCHVMRIRIKYYACIATYYFYFPFSSHVACLSRLIGYRMYSSSLPYICMYICYISTHALKNSVRRQCSRSAQQPCQHCHRQSRQHCHVFCFPIFRLSHSLYLFHFLVFHFYFFFCRFTL